MGHPDPRELAIRWANSLNIHDPDQRAAFIHEREQIATEFLQSFAHALKVELQHGNIVNEHVLKHVDDALTRLTQRALSPVPAAITSRDRHLIRATQDDMPLVEAPFKLMAENAGISEDKLFAWLEEMQSMNYLRRIAAILRHQKAGFTDNGMITWKVPEDRVDEAGRIAASYSTVSHCYRRPIYPDWPYNLFSMVHARSRENAEEIGRQIAEELRPLGVTEYAILFSTKEFKKDRVRYFVDWDLAEAPQVNPAAI